MRTQPQRAFKEKGAARTSCTFAAAFLTLASSLGAAADKATAQGTWHVTNLHPPGVSSSQLTGTTGAMQYGDVTINNFPFASLWEGTVESWRNVAPSNGGASSSIMAHAGPLLVGTSFYVSQNTVFKWGTTWDARTGASSPIALGSEYSTFQGTSGAQHVGWYTPHPDGGGGQVVRAILWDASTPFSFTYLNPPNALWSQALVTDGTRQAGWASLVGTSRTAYQASIWYGTAASWINIHPPGATTSMVIATDGHGQLGGWATFAGVTKAGLWVDTAAQWTPLDPVNATESKVTGMTRGFQVGYATILGESRAALWRGTPSSWVDLHALLPAGYSSSHATGVAYDGNTLVVAGSARNTSTGRSEAFMWRLIFEPLCDSTDFNRNGFFPEDQDLIDLLSVLAGGPCSTGTCNDIDFNNDGLFPSDDDLIAYLRVLAGGPC